MHLHEKSISYFTIMLLLAFSFVVVVCCMCKNMGTSPKGGKTWLFEELCGIMGRLLCYSSSFCFCIRSERSRVGNVNLKLYYILYLYLICNKVTLCIWNLISFISRRFLHLIS